MPKLMRIDPLKLPIRAIATIYDGLVFSSCFAHGRPGQALHDGNNRAICCLETACSVPIDTLIVLGTIQRLQN